MALVALTTADTVDFVSALDPSATTVEVPVDPKKPDGPTHKKVTGWSDEASVFKLSALDVYLMGHIVDSATEIRRKDASDQVDVSTKVNRTNIDVVRHGLTGIPDNFCDRSGKPVELRRKEVRVNGRPYQVVEDGVMNMLGLPLIGEMAEAIRGISEVKAEEAKN